jgi:hypothetical protein
MKKIFVLFLIFVSVTSVINAQTTCGALIANEVWSSNVHVTCDVTVGDGITLTISPGVIVSFDGGASLIISGSGRLLADGGSSSNYITFTAFNTSWGHLNFNNSTATQNSIINYCIIEKGNAPSSSSLHGGGIIASTSKLIISNTLIHNNNADWGGGVFVDKTYAPSISNCKIYLNTATYGGGGLYFWNTSSSLVTNCVIYKNTVTGYGYGGGGVLIGPSTGNVKIVNSVIANNTATNSNGAGIYFYTSSSASIINSIIWGTPDQLNFFSTSTNVMQYCGIKGVSYTTCLNLNSDNNQPDGPNFTDPINDDYSIKFISPCRDAGTSIGAPLTDYLGNGRIGPYDIGAYEVQYSRWKSNASTPNWNTGGNWVGGVPNSSRDIIIPHISGTSPVYPTGSPTQSFTLGAGKMMILEPGAQLTLGVLTNTSGTLRLLSKADSIASLLISGYVNSGTTEIQLYLEGNGSGTLWHYVSPPVTSLSATTLGSSNSSIAKYEENLISNNMNNGWVTYNGYHYDITLNPPAWVQAGLNWPTMDAGSGYNYFSTANKTYTLNGTVNVSDVPVNLVYNSGGFTANQNEQGFNLIGNPFTCGLDWDGVVNANSTIFNVNNVETTIYFRLNGVTIYYNNGFTVPNTYNSDGSLIPPMQGFFIKTNNNVTLNLPTSAKTHTANKRYKGNSTAPHIRLQYENSIKSDQTVIYFDEKATLGFDKMLDGRKAFLTDSDPYIYSIIDGIKYSINGIPFPKDSITIPLVVNAITDGSYTIKATELVDLDSYKVFLNDKSQNLTINLANDSSYTFNATTGTLTDRFTVTITNVLTAIPENKVSVEPFNIYSSNGSVNIQTLSDTWNGKLGGIRILDMTGRVLTTEDNVEFSKDDLLQVPVRVATGIYMVELRSGVMRYVGKVVIR